MCYAIPGKVVELGDNKAIIDYFGEKRVVLNEFSLTVGEYVYAQAGVVIQKIDTKSALSILKGWEEDFTRLKQIDEDLAFIDDFEVKDNKILEILKKSELHITNTLALKIEKNKFIWDKNAILNRQQELAELAYDKIWKF